MLYKRYIQHVGVSLTPIFQINVCGSLCNFFLSKCIEDAVIQKIIYKASRGEDPIINSISNIY